MPSFRTKNGNEQTPSEAFRIRAKQFQEDILALNALLLSASPWFAEGKEVTSQPCEQTLELLHQALDLFEAFHQLLESASEIPEVSPHIYTLNTALRVNLSQVSHLESLIKTLLNTQRKRNLLQKGAQLQPDISILLETLIQSSEESMQVTSTAIDRSCFQEKILADLHSSRSKPKPQKVGRVIKFVKKSSI